MQVLCNLSAAACGLLSGVCGSSAACASHPPWVPDCSAGVWGDVACLMRLVRTSVRWRRTGGRMERRPGRTVFINRAMDRKGSNWASINRAIDGFWLNDLLLNCRSLKSRDWRILPVWYAGCVMGEVRNLERKGEKKMAKNAHEFDRGHLLLLLPNLSRSFLLCLGRPPTTFGPCKWTCSSAKREWGAP